MMFPGAICKTCGKARGGEDRVASLERQLAEAQTRLEDVYLKDRGKTNEINILTQEVRTLTAQLAEAQTTKARMQEFIQRHGYGHTDWKEPKTGCGGNPGPGCIGSCVARCENIDNLNAAVFDQRATLHTLTAEHAAMRKVVEAAIEYVSAMPSVQAPRTTLGNAVLALQVRRG